MMIVRRINNNIKLSIVKKLFITSVILLDCKYLNYNKY